MKTCFVLKLHVENRKWNSFSVPIEMRCATMQGRQSLRCFMKNDNTFTIDILPYLRAISIFSNFRISLGQNKNTMNYKRIPRHKFMLEKNHPEASPLRRIRSFIELFRLSFLFSVGLAVACERKKRQISIALSIWIWRSGAMNPFYASMNNWAFG